MRKLSIFAILIALVALGGCNSTENGGEATTPPATEGGKGKEGEAATGGTAQGGGRGGAELGTAEMTPGMSASEADARVGSAMKNK
ncbi:MAG: hypothetical protein SFX74_04020 [Fimbriimonadaceae bacterium]|nr:hypothetical protein [Fimbriimonadaceae bacterium]